MPQKGIERPDYWDDRYKKKTDVWSLYSPNPVFEELLANPPMPLGKKMIIPGCGLGHDAAFAASGGFDVTAVDFASLAAASAREAGSIPGQQFSLVQADIFAMPSEHCGLYDTLYEYTFICSFEPVKHPALLRVFSDLLKPGGIFISILFPMELREGGPPFGLDARQFITTASLYFDLLLFKKNIPSIRPRKGREALFIFKKRNTEN